MFKLKSSNIINFFILSLDNLKLKKLNILYKNLTFDYIYIYTAYVLLATIFLFSVVI